MRVQLTDDDLSTINTAALASLELVHWNGTEDTIWLRLAAKLWLQRLCSAVSLWRKRQPEFTVPNLRYLGY